MAKKKQSFEVVETTDNAEVKKVGRPKQVDIIGDFLKKQEEAQAIGRAKERELKQAKREAKKEQSRERCFCLISYIEVKHLDWYLRNAKWIHHFAYLTHDKDVKDDGSIKETHTHILLYTYDGKTSSAVKKNFDHFSAEFYKDKETEAQNTLCQVCVDPCTQYRYQMHLDDPDKYQYGSELRVVDDISYWTKFEKSEGMASAKNTSLSIVNEMLRGVPTMTLVERYGKDYIYHIGHYKQAVNDIIKETRREDLNNAEEFFKLMLDTSDYTSEQVTMFLSMFAYIQKESRQCYLDPIKYYIGD